MLKNQTIIFLLVHHDPTPGHRISQYGQEGLCISRFYPNDIAVPRDGTIDQFTRHDRIPMYLDGKSR